jgi:hypothetical protein
MDLAVLDLPICVEYPWIAQMFILLQSGHTDPTIDIIFENMNDLLIEGKFSDVEKIYKDLPVKNCDTTILISFLTTRIWCWLDLTDLGLDFYTRCKEVLVSRNTPDLDSLLLGLDRGLPCELTAIREEQKKLF